jgi:hypothetical protein
MDKAKCALCWIDGKRSPAIKGWDGIPICREHLAETIVTVHGQTAARPSPGLSCTTLQ